MSYRSGFVAIVGRANVGKSTLLNSLIGQKISIVSDKAQTTRMRVQGVLTLDEGQIVFVDTPGMHKPKNKLDNYMVDVIDEAVTEMDLIMMLIDGSAGVGPGDVHMASRLPQGVHKFLLINKIDLMNETQFAQVMKEVEKLGSFTEVLGISAQDEKTVKGLADKIMSYLPEGPLYFPEEDWTNLNEKTLIAELIREKALMYLDQEIPHGIAVLIDSLEKEDQLLRIQATIVVERESHKGIVIGKGGRKLKGIGKQARKEIEQMYEKNVFLELWVKVKDNWRNVSHYVEDFGYRK